MEQNTIDFFKDFKLDAPKEKEAEIYIPIINYPSSLWPTLSPLDAGFQFIKDFDSNIQVFASIFTSSISPATIVKDNGGRDILLISLTSSMRKYLNTEAKIIYEHKSTKYFDARISDEITSSYSEFGTALIANTLFCILGFKKRISPDFAQYMTRDLGDIRIGTTAFDIKHRDESYTNGGWFTDADYMIKNDARIGNNTIFIYTTGREKWNLEKLKNTNNSYELALVGSFTKEMFNKSSLLKKDGARRVMDTINMSDIKALFTLWIKEVAMEEGYLK